MPKLRHIDGTGTARFVTFTCYRRHRYLNDPVARKFVIAGLSNLRSQLGIKILGYVIMPEHIHLVLLPPDEIELGIIIGQLKGRIAKKIISDGVYRSTVLKRPDGSPAIWQRRCYDHNCRLPEVVIEKINYCHKNPVIRGSVNSTDDWPWSSSRWYSGNGEIILEIDGYEM